MEINLRRAWPRPKFHCSAQEMKVYVELKSYTVILLIIVNPAPESAAF